MEMSKVLSLNHLESEFQVRGKNFFLVNVKIPPKKTNHIEL